MRRILLATDGSRNALGAAHYVANLHKGASDVEVTVLNVSPSIPPIYRELGHGHAVHRQFMAWKKKREEEAKGYFEAASKVLLEAGLKKSHIKTRYLHQVVGVARDIIRELDAGPFDACVIGKKGMGWFDFIFLGGITSKLLEISENHPVWLVDGNGGKAEECSSPWTKPDMPLNSLATLEGCFTGFLQFIFSFTTIVLPSPKRFPLKRESV